MAKGFKLSTNTGIIRRDVSSNTFTHSGKINIDGSEYLVYADRNGKTQKMIIYLTPKDAILFDHQIRELQSVGAISPNSDVVSEKSPTHKGRFTMGYNQYSISGWTKLGSRFKFLSVAVDLLEDI